MCERREVGQVKKGMILAAGEGTRLRPLTLDRPKPMLPVAGRPVLEYTIAWLRYYGITQIAINLHHCPQVVMNHFRDGSAFGVEITYSVEKAIQGTAGGVKRVARFFDGPLVLVYGDVLTDLDLKALVDFHFDRPVGPHMSMSLYRVPNPWECGIVGLNGQGRVIRFVEKPAVEDVFSNLASAGVLVVDPELLEYVPDGCFYDFGRDLFPRLLQLGVPMYGWPLPDTAYLIDIGTLEKYARVQQEWPTLAAHRFLGYGGEQ
ncbi:MAG: nucleotidyltransferase family protein [Chloroflexi bacterium]|nr:nucleotidyltransferase family protein [Chloroflexota bacterium]